MTRVTTDVDALNDMFASGVVTVFGDVLVLVGIMAAMLLMNWRLALVAFTVLPLIAWSTAWFRKNVRESYRQVRGLVARLNAFLQEHLTGMPTVQLFVQEARTFDRFDAINRDHRDVNIASIFFYAVFYPVIEILAALSSALIIWVGGGWALEACRHDRRARRVPPVLAAVLPAHQRPVGEVQHLPGGDGGLRADLHAARYAGGHRGQRAGRHGGGGSLREPDRPAPRHPGLAATRIEFDHVWFAYSGDALRAARRLVHDRSRRAHRHRRRHRVRARRRSSTCCCGSMTSAAAGSSWMAWTSGSGRSTTCAARFGLVLQDVHLFSGTIASNIRLGERGDLRRGRSPRGARRCTRTSSSSGSEHGYDTVVAERGATLSVGQKQLLSFARALAFEPPVLVLDEATSSIDTETEALIQDALHVLMAGRTVLAIAHRLSTIQDMDRILVLHKGELRERGTHQELIARRGLYYRLYQLQYQDGSQRLMRIRGRGSAQGGSRAALTSRCPADSSRGAAP